MTSFVLLFRMDITSPEAQPSPAQMRVYMEQWTEWIGGISEKGRLADGGNHFSKKGTVLRPKGDQSDGPYTVQKESVAGYIIIDAKNLKEAVAIAKDCPILQGEGTSVEVREVGVPG